MHNMSNIEVHGLQQHKATLSSTAFSQKQESEATVGTDSPKLDILKLEQNIALFDEFQFL